MPEIFGALILILICSIVGIWEYSKYNTIVTPFGVLAWPYTVIVFMVNIFGVQFGYFSVSLQSILLVILCLFFFLAGGYGIRYIMPINSTNAIMIRAGIPTTDLRNLLNYYRPLVMVLALISIIAGAIQFTNCVSEFGLLNIGGKEFRRVYTSGLYAHLLFLGRPAFIFLFIDYVFRNRKYVLLLMIVLFFFIVVSLAKYYVFTALLSGFYFAYFYKLTNFKFKKILFYVIVIYLLFNLTYVIAFSALGIKKISSSEVQSFFFNNFFMYLFGGPIGFSEILKNPSYPLFDFEKIIAAPINIVKVINGDINLVHEVIRHFIPIANNPNYPLVTNVYTMFGMLYMFVGTYSTLIICFIAGIFYYFMGSFVKKSKGYVAFQLIFIYTLSYLTLSFFGLYFNMLNFIEVPVYIGITFVFYQIIRDVLLKSKLHSEKT